MSVRLDKFLSECSEYSRKEIKMLIKQGSITVNEKTAQKSDMRVDENNDAVEIYGKRIEYKKYIYLMMNKPKGYVSANKDKIYPTVTELLPEQYRRWQPFCAGRLDVDTEGLLILTNDGEFAHRIISPGKEVYKKYFAVLDKPAVDADIDVFQNGIQFKDYTTRPAKMEICDNPCEVYISICEGKFHQVKKMCAYVGKNVTYLKRISVGNIILDEKLNPGEVKEINNDIIL